MMRKELKYTLNKGDFDIFSSHLIDSGFTPIFNERIIYSLYYDTDSFELFNLSEDGNNERKKFRIRFYNQETSEAFLEIKEKKGSAGWKTKANLWNFKNLTLITSNSFRPFKIPQVINLGLIPLIGVTYNRNYFISNCSRFRLTFDRKIKYGKILKYSNKFNVEFDTPSEIDIIELKFDFNLDFYSSSLIPIFENYNLILSKFSKYCYGIKMIY